MDQLCSAQKEPSINCCSSSFDRCQFNHMFSITPVPGQSRDSPEVTKALVRNATRTIKKLRPEAKPCLTSPTLSRFVAAHLCSCIVALFLELLRILVSECFYLKTACFALLFVLFHVSQCSISTFGCSDLLYWSALWPLCFDLQPL